MMLKHYIFMLFPIIMFGNNAYSTDPNSYKTSKNYILKSEFFSNYINNYYMPNNKQNIINFYDRNQIYEKEIKLLKNEKDDLNKKLFSIQKKLLSQEIKYKLIQNYINTLEDNISKLNSNNNDLTNQLSNITVQIKTKIKENNKLLNVIENLKAEKEELNSKVKEIQQELVTVEEYKKRIKDILEENKQLNSKLSQVQKDNNDLQDKLSSYITLQQELLGLKNKNKKLNNTLSNNTVKIMNIENQIQEKKRQVSNLKQQMNERNKEVLELKLRDKENNNKIFDLEQKIEKLISNAKRFNNLQITSQSININNINELKQNNKSEYINPNAGNINKISNNNSCVKNTNNREQNDNKIKDNNNSVQNINSTANKNNNIVNNVKDMSNIIQNDSIVNNNLNVPNINSEELNSNEITDKINNNKDIKDTQIENIQNEVSKIDKNEIILKEVEEENTKKVGNSNKVKKKKKHKKKNKKSQEVNNITQNQDIQNSDENKKVVENDIVETYDKYSNNKKYNKKENDNCNKKIVKQLKEELNAAVEHEQYLMERNEQKIELFHRTITKYEEKRNNIKYLKDAINNISYELPIENEIKYSKEYYEKIHEQNQYAIEQLYNQLNQYNNANAVKISNNSIELYQIKNNNNFLMKDQVTYRNLIIFIIGKILEIQQYNYDAKNVNENLKIPTFLINVNHTNIMSFLPENNIQNCVKLINDNMYYNFGYTCKCNNHILQNNIFQNSNNGIAKCLSEELYNDICVLRRYITTINLNTKNVLNGLENYVFLENMQELLYKQNYKCYMADILSYAYLLSINEINGNKVDSEYKKIIEILCNQLFCIADVVQISNSFNEIQLLIKEVINGSIKLFMPYIKYWKEMDKKLLIHETSEGNYLETSEGNCCKTSEGNCCKTSEGNCCETSEGNYFKKPFKVTHSKSSEENYSEISARIEGYVDNVSQKLSIKQKLTLENIIDTINDFFQNNLKLNYTFTF